MIAFRPRRDATRVRREDSSVACVDVIELRGNGEPDSSRNKPHEHQAPLPRPNGRCGGNMTNTTAESTVASAYEVIRRNDGGFWISLAADAPETLAA